jgi:hypothetical protein
MAVKLLARNQTESIQHHIADFVAPEEALMVRLFTVDIERNYLMHCDIMLANEKDKSKSILFLQ